MIVTFCGHREIPEPDRIICAWLSETVAALIDRGASLFFLGGYGEFDRMAASVVRGVTRDGSR